MKVLAAVLIASVAPASAQPRSAGHLKRCGKIVFSPNSDNLADSIRARNTTCRGARLLVRRIHGRHTRRGYGYRCASRALGTPLPLTKWHCVKKGGRRVGWVKG